MTFLLRTQYVFYFISAKMCLTFPGAALGLVGKVGLGGKSVPGCYWGAVVNKKHSGGFI